MTFNLAGILGGSLVPFVATPLATSFGLVAIGYYLSSAALISVAALTIARSRPSADIVSTDSGQHEVRFGSAS
jgi:hypothetical protein